MSIYKGDKLVAGSSVTTGQGGGDSGLTAEYIRNLHDPDWSKATMVTRDQFIAGYTAPARGIIVGFSSGLIYVEDEHNAILGSGHIAVKVNDVILASSILFTENNQSELPTINCSVSRGDVFRAAQLEMIDYGDAEPDINNMYTEVNVGDAKYVLDQIVGITNLRFVPYKAQ